MFKFITAAVLALASAAAFAATDVNKASQAELEAVKGIGPGLSGKILAARKDGALREWDDLGCRVGAVAQDHLCVREQTIARHGCYGSPGAARQQRCAQRLLEVLDAAGQSRLAYEDALGRRGEVAELDDGHEVTQLAQLDHGALCLAHTSRSSCSTRSTAAERARRSR